MDATQQHDPATSSSSWEAGQYPARLDNEDNRTVTEPRLAGGPGEMMEKRVTEWLKRQRSRYHGVDHPLLDLQHYLQYPATLEWNNDESFTAGLKALREVVLGKRQSCLLSTGLRRQFPKGARRCVCRAFHSYFAPVGASFPGPQIYSFRTLQQSRWLGRFPYQALAGECSGRTRATTLLRVIKPALLPILEDYGTMINANNLCDLLTEDFAKR